MYEYDTGAGVDTAGVEVQLQQQCRCECNDITNLNTVAVQMNRVECDKFRKRCERELMYSQCKTHIWPFSVIIGIVQMHHSYLLSSSMEYCISQRSRYRYCSFEVIDTTTVLVNLQPL